MGVVAIPIVVVIVAAHLSYQQDVRQQEIDEGYAESALQVEEQRAQDEALQSYLDQMNDLFIERNLPDSENESPVQDLARARTLTVLDRLSPDRKVDVLRFLYEANMIGKENPVVDINVANLQGIHIDYNTLLLHDADLSGANLTGSDLQDVELDRSNMEGVILYEADIRNAFLIDVNLSRARMGSTEDVFTLVGEVEPQKAADLRGADLRNANLSWAFLAEVDMSPLRFPRPGPELRDDQRTDLSDANLRHAQLPDANLRGAILKGADFTCANLINTDFTNATGITKEQLANQAEFLEGAVAPDGSIYDSPYENELRNCIEPAAP